MLPTGGNNAIRGADDVQRRNSDAVFVDRTVLGGQGLKSCGYNMHETGFKVAFETNR